MMLKILVAFRHMRPVNTLVFALIFSCFILSAKSQQALPRSTPEEQGVSSQAIITFLDSMATTRHEMHSVMIVRHGKVIAEGWWDPYRSDLKHTMYSCSKSFTATAIGFAVKEKRLKVTDKVISFFPNDLPDTISANLRDLSVRDLLSMSVGQDPEPTFTVVTDSNWVKAFLQQPIPHEPGTKFLYNSGATYMLSAIVQKVTGEKVIDYLSPRLFQPLGIEGIDWETDNRGINVGGWGLRLKTEDMAKFGLLFLNRGKWNNKRILPKRWIKEASTAKIIQHPEFPQSKRDSSDWEQGYCYQMWRSRHNSYRGDGAFGQYILVLPEQDAVIAITSETTDMQDELNQVWRFLLPAMQTGKLDANAEVSAQLNQRLRSLSLPKPKNESSSTLAGSLSGKTFALEKNEWGMRSVSFEFNDQSCELSITTDTSKHNLRFASGKWQPGETTMKGPYLVTAAKNNLKGLPPFQVAGIYNWNDENTLEFVLRFIESPHTQTLTCHFENGKLQLEIKNSFSDKAVTINGQMN